MFIYDPLSESSSMRLIRLLSTRINNQIQARLVHRNGPQMKYRCLSYMWGLPTEQNDILLNEQPFPVRRNLFTFLNMATGYFADESLWIDAICINQTDLVEKSHQVQRMGDIYRNAEEILVWLGFDDCFDCIFGPWKGNRKKLVSHFDTDALLACINHPYFTRAWITQEILLAPKIVVLHKNLQLRWWEFAKRFQYIALELGRRRVRTQDIVVLELFDMRKTANWRKGPSALLWPIISYVWEGVPLTSELSQTSTGLPSGNGYYDFFDVLRRRAQSQCMDTRDRIFSLNSLLEPGHGFEVDYHNSATDVFWKVCEHFNAWVDFTRVRQIADALSLSTMEILQTIEGKLDEKIILRFQEGQFHELKQSRLGDAPDSESRPLYCKKNLHKIISAAARVEKRNKDDLLLCPLQYGISQTPEIMRPHLVVSQVSPDDAKSLTMTLFYGQTTQHNVTQQLYYFDGKDLQPKDWSEIKRLRTNGRSKAKSGTWWALQLPLFFAIDVVAGAREEKVPEIANTLKTDWDNDLASSNLKTAFLYYTQNM